MATYKTQIRWGGISAEWHDGAYFVVEIKNRKDVVPAIGVPSEGTQVSWSGADGNGNITFTHRGKKFTGSAQFPPEKEPVDFCGQLKG